MIHNFITLCNYLISNTLGFMSIKCINEEKDEETEEKDEEKDEEEKKEEDEEPHCNCNLCYTFRTCVYLSLIHI